MSTKQNVCKAVVSDILGQEIPNLNDPYNCKRKEKLIILQSIGNIVAKSKETRVVTYNCRYSSGLIPLIVPLFYPC